jgi:hypothetical protein
METIVVPQMKVRSSVRAGAGGYVNGIYYPDMSGTCSTGSPAPTPPPSGSTGGTVGGVYYPDMSGTCA